MRYESRGWLVPWAGARHRQGRCAEASRERDGEAADEGRRLGEERIAAVDDEGLPADHVRGRRGEKADGVGDLGRLDEPAGRRPRAMVGEHLLAVREVVERTCLDKPGRHGVDAYPARRELDR